jgi:hypothetical protein
MFQLHKGRIMRRYLPIILGVLCMEAATRAEPQPTTVKSEAIWIQRVRQAVPKGWSLKRLRPNYPAMVRRDEPIRVVYNSPIAPSPVKQTLGITVIVGPKVSPTELKAMVQFNANLKQKFKGNGATLRLMAPLMWWDKRTKNNKHQPYLLPTHFDGNNSFRIACKQLRGHRYEIKVKADADEALGVYAAIASRFKSHTASVTQPEAPVPPITPLKVVCSPQFAYIDKKQHLTIRCDFENTTKQPFIIRWGKPQIRVWPKVLDVTTYGVKADNHSVLIQPGQKKRKTVDIVMGQDCPYLDEGSWRISMLFYSFSGGHQYLDTAYPLHVEVKSAGATAGQIVAAAAAYRRKASLRYRQHKPINYKQWKIHWWSKSHWGVDFSIVGAGVSRVEIDKITLKPREWRDVIVVKIAPPTTAPATQPGVHRGQPAQRE